MPALSHAPKDPDHWADLVSTCTWTRHILALHAGDARRACRARFDETAAELPPCKPPGRRTLDLNNTITCVLQGPREEARG